MSAVVEGAARGAEAGARAFPAPYPTLLTVALAAIVIYSAVQLVRLEKAEAAERAANRRKALGNRGVAR